MVDDPLEQLYVEYPRGNPQFDPPVAECTELDDKQWKALLAERQSVRCVTSLVYIFLVFGTLKVIRISEGELTGAKLEAQIFLAVVVLLSATVITGLLCWLPRRDLEVFDPAYTSWRSKSIRKLAWFPLCLFAFPDMHCRRIDEIMRKARLGCPSIR